MRHAAKEGREIRKVFFFCVGRYAAKSNTLVKPVIMTYSLRPVKYEARYKRDKRDKKSMKVNIVGVIIWVVR